MKKSKQIMRAYLAIITLIALPLSIHVWGSIDDTVREGSTIYLVPVYGQSLALGEEAQLVTDVDSLLKACDYRLLGVELNNNLGYFHQEDLWKQRLKLILRSNKRRFETSCYSLGAYLIESLISHGDDSSYVCTFEAGCGATCLEDMSKGSIAYEKFIDQLQRINNVAREKNCNVIIPAFCFVQGETNLTSSRDSDYRRKLSEFRQNLETDIRRIFSDQKNLFAGRKSLACVLYQTSCLSIAEDGYNPLDYDSHVLNVPNAQRQLIMEDSTFVASCPVYQFNVVREYVHIDAKGQQSLGKYEGRAVADLLFANKKDIGFQLKDMSIDGSCIVLSFDIPEPPLSIDTSIVNKVANYGFSVVTPENKNILDRVEVRDSTIVLYCNKNVESGLKVRYGMNGDVWKSGRLHGPRGNICDSDTLSNYLYMFEVYSE